MIKRLIVLSMLWAMPTSASAQSDFVLPACDLSVERTLMWPAMDQEVTLLAEIKGESGRFPAGNSYLVFADGQKVHLGEGGKYIDDFTADDVPSCEDHMDQLISPIISSINPKDIDKQFSFMPNTMGEMAKVLSLAETCVETDKKTYIFRRMECKDVKRIAHDFQEYSEILPEDFERLVAQDAPFIEVPYSTYGRDTYVMDTKSRKLYAIPYPGC